MFTNNQAYIEQHVTLRRYNNSNCHVIMNVFVVFSRYGDME